MPRASAAGIRPVPKLRRLAADGYGSLLLVSAPNSSMGAPLPLNRTRPTGSHGVQVSVRTPGERLCLEPGFRWLSRGPGLMDPWPPDSGGLCKAGHTEACRI